MKQSWGDLIVATIFSLVTLYFAWTGEIQWRGLGYTRRSEHPILYYLVLAALTAFSMYLFKIGLEKHGLLP